MLKQEREIGITGESYGGDTYHCREIFGSLGSLDELTVIKTDFDRISTDRSTYYSKEEISPPLDKSTVF